MGGNDIHFVQEKKNDDSAFYAILPEATIKGRQYKMTIEYGGEKVLENAGGGSYYVGARTSWYPSVNAFTDRATFDLTFKVPSKYTLVSNGKLDGLGRRIAVIGAQTQLDDVTAQMVAQALRAEGAEVVALPLRAVLPRALRSFKPETLVVVTLGTANSASVDLQVRQLRRRLSEVRIGVAKWSVSDSAPPESPRKPVADFVASGMEALFENAFAAAAEKAA